MPETTAEHYRNKIAVYLRWYQKKGMEDIPDTQPADIGTKDIPILAASLQSTAQ
ncbi:co-activator of prophage gene expression IbrA [Klebsiella pneumoniae]|uniref:Co-activator of prophage gene expression IbrA n=1 Tax=Klebsiella pneumoniae TaxID=573 RepID=A0A3S4KMG6_KLEPN|nr:co-activator of prophage gene expression IbrA [Klebsiella pneumoniae]